MINPGGLLGFFLLKSLQKEYPDQFVSKTKFNWWQGALLIIGILAAAILIPWLLIVVIG